MFAIPNAFQTHSKRIPNATATKRDQPLICADNFGQDKAFPLQSIPMSKIDQVSQGLARDTQVVEHLRFMLRGQFGDRFELDHNTTKNVEIRDIALLKLSSFVKNC